jgi:hypothetical protein
MTALWIKCGTCGADVPAFKFCDQCGVGFETDFSEPAGRFPDKAAEAPFETLSTGEILAAGGNPAGAAHVARHYCEAGRSLEFLSGVPRGAPYEFFSNYCWGFLAAGDYDAAFELLRKAGTPVEKDLPLYNILRRVISRRRPGGLFAAQERYVEKLELAAWLAGCGRGMEASAVLDDVALAAAGKDENDAYVVAEILDRAGEVEAFAAKAGAGRPAGFYSVFASAFEKRNKPDAVAELLRLKGKLDSDDFPLLIWALARQGKLEEIAAASVPEPHRVLLAEAWVEREGENVGLGILDGIPRANWKPREYACAMRAMQRLGRMEQVRALFLEASRAYGLKRAPELHYYYALFCERMAEIDAAIGIYGELGSYRDAAERRANLEALSPDERSRASTALSATFLRETMARSGQAPQDAPQESLVARRFEILRPLGVGAMGIVFRARDRQSGRDVALKKMKAGLASDPHAKQRFLNEARTLAELQHPGIVSASGTVEWTGETYIICELVEGETFAELLAGRGRIPPGDCARVLADVCAALAHAHGKSVVHRDLKPGNIMQDRGGAVKVMDFGIALHSGDPRLTATGFGAGTPAYMAPEQHEGRADFRSDLYALGVTAYELVTGRLPFSGIDFVDRKRRGDYEALGPEVPRALKEFISACLRPDPAQRPPSAEACAQLLAGTGQTGAA